MNKRFGLFAIMVSFALAAIRPIYSCPVDTGASSIKSEGNGQTSGPVSALHMEMKAFRQTQGRKILELRAKIDQELLKASPDRKLLESYISQQVELRASITKKWMESLLKIKGMVPPLAYSKYVDGNWGCGCGDADCAGVPKKKASVELEE